MSSVLDDALKNNKNRQEAPRLQHVCTAYWFGSTMRFAQTMTGATNLDYIFFFRFRFFFPFFFSSFFFFAQKKCNRQRCIVWRDQVDLAVVVAVVVEHGVEELAQRVQLEGLQHVSSEQ
jgi:hypothetical protein